MCQAVGLLVIFASLLLSIFFKHNYIRYRKTCYDINFFVFCNLATTHQTSLSSKYSLSQAFHSNPALSHTSAALTRVPSLEYPPTFLNPTHPSRGRMVGTATGWREIPGFLLVNSQLAGAGAKSHLHSHYRPPSLTS